MLMIKGDLLKMKVNTSELNKYDRKIATVITDDSKKIDVYVDVYDVIAAFKVTCPAAAHAIKKLLAPGQRGVKSKNVDLREAQISIKRSIQLHLGNDYYDEDGEG